MAWCEFHDTLRAHHKTLRAARLLSLRPVYVMGHLGALWTWALQNAQDGDLTDLDHEDIAQAAGWDGPPDDFVTALLVCGKKDRPGFLERTEEGRLVLHDWHDYAGKLLERRNAEAERKRLDRERRASAGRPRDVQDDERRTPSPAPSGAIGGGGDGAKGPVATGKDAPRDIPQPGASDPPDVRSMSAGRPSDILRHRTLPYQEKRESSEPLRAPELNELAFPIVGGGARDWIPPSGLLEELAKLYPGLDVGFQVSKARLWCLTNPVKQKTARGMPRFLSSWMERAQNDLGRNGGGNGRRPSAAPPEPVDNDEETRKHREWLKANGFLVPTEGPS